VQSVVAPELDAETALRLLDAMRWLCRVSDHMWRIAHHVDDLASDNHRHPPT